MEQRAGFKNINQIGNRLYVQLTEEKRFFVSEYAQEVGKGLATAGWPVNSNQKNDKKMTKNEENFPENAKKTL